MIPPLHHPAQAEAAPPQAQPLGLQGGDEDQREQARAGGEEVDGRVRRAAAAAAGSSADLRGLGGEPRRDRLGEGHLERGGAVAELVVEDLCVGAGDLEVAEGVGVEAVYAGGAGCCLACEGGNRAVLVDVRR